MLTERGRSQFTRRDKWRQSTDISNIRAVRRSIFKGYSTSVGDEGGFAPNLKSNEEACELIVEAITAAGYQPGRDVAIALDPAASSFFAGGAYDLAKSGQGQKSSAEMTDLYKEWVSKYPIVSIEDGLDENDWTGFKEHTEALGQKVQIVGDESSSRIHDSLLAVSRNTSANAVLIKLNQIGTVTETIELKARCSCQAMIRSGRGTWE